MTETDPRAERPAAKQHPGGAGAGRVFDNAKIAGGTTGGAGDFPKKILPNEHRGIVGATETINAPA